MCIRLLLWLHLLWIFLLCLQVCFLKNVLHYFALCMRCQALLVKRMRRPVESQSSSSSSFIVRFPCYAQVGRFPPIKLLRLVLSSAHSLANAVSDGVGSNFLRTIRTRITKFYCLIWDNQPHKHATYDFDSCFHSTDNAVEYCIKVCKTGPDGKELNDSVTV